MSKAKYSALRNTLKGDITPGTRRLVRHTGTVDGNHDWADDWDVYDENGNSICKEGNRPRVGDPELLAASDPETLQSLLNDLDSANTELEQVRNQLRLAAELVSSLSTQVKECNQLRTKLEALSKVMENSEESQVLNSTGDISSPAPELPNLWIRELPTRAGLYIWRAAPGRFESVKRVIDAYVEEDSSKTQLEFLEGGRVAYHGYGGYWLGPLPEHGHNLQAFDLQTAKQEPQRLVFLRNPHWKPTGVSSYYGEITTYWEGKKVYNFSHASAEAELRLRRV